MQNTRCLCKFNPSQAREIDRISLGELTEAGGRGTLLLAFFPAIGSSLRVARRRNFRLSNVR